MLRIAGILIAFGIIGDLAAMEKVDQHQPGFDETLRKTIPHLPSSTTLRSDEFGDILVVPARAVLQDKDGVILRTKQADERPSENDVLIFVKVDVDREFLAAALRKLPDSLIPTNTPIWLCVFGDSKDKYSPGLEFPQTGGLQFRLSRLLPPTKRLTPISPSVKRAEGPDNLRRRGDWFRSGTKQR